MIERTCTLFEPRSLTLGLGPLIEPMSVEREGSGDNRREVVRRVMDVEPFVEQKGVESDAEDEEGESKEQVLPGVRETVAKCQYDDRHFKSKGGGGADGEAACEGKKEEGEVEDVMEPAFQEPEAGAVKAEAEAGISEQEGDKHTDI